jgi:tetratricopeptide (TPR) repeat protein
MPRTFAVLAFWLLTTGGSLVVQAQDDQVFGLKGTPTRGTITTITAAQVKINASGVPRTFEVKDVLKVTFGDEPDALRAARDKVLAGDYEAAQGQLAKIDMAKVTVEGVKQDIEFYQALCLAKLALGGQGETSKAAGLMVKFKRDNATSYHYFESLQVLGDLAVALGSFDRASEFYGDLGKAPWPEYQLKSVILESHSLMAAGKYAEALTKFELVINSSLTVGEITEQKMYATVGKAQCLALTGKPDAGIKLLEEIIAGQDSSDEKLFGRTYNALGACYAKAGKPKDAVLAYLHTDLLFNSDADAHAESLYYLSKLWGEITQPDRGKRARDTLQNTYPTSRWAQMK